MYQMLVGAVIGAAFVYFGSELLDTPTVYRNVVTQQCVAVEDSYGFRACNQQPDKYEVVFVNYHNFEQMQRSRAK